MNEAIAVARGNGSFDLAENVAVIAPQFLSAVYNSGQYTAQQLAWGDVNAWQAGSVATHPARTTLSSFDALDGLISGFTNRTQYPQLNNVTVVGHGGGGQLVQRYAAVGADFSRDVHVRYVHGDASSCAYFTQDRPYVDYDGLIEPKCEFNNTWRYGYDGYTRADGTVENIQQYFLQYVTRDVVSLVGYQDEAASGDESCMARAQGGRRRRDRNLIWYRYVNTLAGTDEDLSGLPGEFRQLTDWSEVASNSSNLRLVVVQGADHNLERLLQDDTAQRAMFNDWDIGVGWRPAD
jgi:pimeloyl-ACP methyl ester carboxylesterase